MDWFIPSNLFWTAFPKHPQYQSFQEKPALYPSALDDHMGIFLYLFFLVYPELWSIEMPHSQIYNAEIHIITEY